MADLPYQLKTLQPLKGALDILRYFNKTDVQIADVDDIFDDVGITERSFNKAIRRLVTKQYMQMDGDQMYRLTKKGVTAIEDLAEYDGDTDDDFEIEEEEVETVHRRMTMAVPQPLIAGRPTNVLIGFHDAQPGAELPDPAQLVVRLTVVNGQPQSPDDAMFALGNAHDQQAVQITPGKFKEVRVRLEAYQLGDMTGIKEIGGMYVDVPVIAEGSAGQLVAFGTDVKIAP